MSQPKLLPTKWSEIRHSFRDVSTDVSLAFKSGQRRFWDRLGSECEKDSMIHLLKQTLDLQGNIIECGVFRGRSLLKIGHTLRAERSYKKIYGLDSFRGFPQERILEKDLGEGRRMNRVTKKFRYCVSTPARLERIFQKFDIHAELACGFFSETLPQFQHQKFCFIHLDCDIYESYKECLDVLYDCLVPGGIIVFDEYDSHIWPGATLAIDEFFQPLGQAPTRCKERALASMFIRKPVEALRKTA